MRILFICTHNRCRSILAEAIANKMGHGLLIAASAGAHPAGEVHPLTLKYLAEAGYATDGLHSQGWDELKAFNPHIVITVCDQAAGETCPVWLEKGVRVHWGLPDPSRELSSEEETADAFREVIRTLEKRMEQLTKVNINQLSPAEVRFALEALALV
ncbi:MAG: arsenate reductase ArsC [Hahellaceae bacterium]|nr:arsenate reductase ArsC [Hahellaceae bacterium]MCP5169764.1 arsenate reductase ArsC [Hahellaceae bacterium]